MRYFFSALLLTALATEVLAQPRRESVGDARSVRQQAEVIRFDDRTLPRRVLESTLTGDYLMHRIERVELASGEVTRALVVTEQRGDVFLDHYLAEAGCVDIAPCMAGLLHVMTHEYRQIRRRMGPDGYEVATHNQIRRIGPQSLRPSAMQADVPRSPNRGNARGRVASALELTWSGHWINRVEITPATTGIEGTMLYYTEDERLFGRSRYIVPPGAIANTLEDQAAQCRAAAETVFLSDWFGQTTTGNVLAAVVASGTQASDVGAALYESSVNTAVYSESIFDGAGIRNAIEAAGGGLWVSGEALQRIASAAYGAHDEIVVVGLEMACRQYFDDRARLEDFSPELVEQLEAMEADHDDGAAGNTVPSVEERCTSYEEDDEIVVSCVTEVRSD